jgi:hypothetical protein
MFERSTFFSHKLMETKKESEYVEIRRAFSSLETCLIEEVKQCHQHSDFVLRTTETINSMAKEIVLLFPDGYSIKKYNWNGVGFDLLLSDLREIVQQVEHLSQSNQNTVYPSLAPESEAKLVRFKRAVTDAIQKISKDAAVVKKREDNKSYGPYVDTFLRSKWNSFVGGSFSTSVLFLLIWLVSPRK